MCPDSNATRRGTFGHHFTKSPRLTQPLKHEIIGKLAHKARAGSSNPSGVRSRRVVLPYYALAVDPGFFRMEQAMTNPQKIRAGVMLACSIAAVATLVVADVSGWTLSEGTVAILATLAAALGTAGGRELPQPTE